MADTWEQVTSLITHTVAPDNQQPLRAAIRSAKAADHARIAALEQENARLKQKPTEDSAQAILDAFDEGMVAAGAGQTKAANPYDAGDSWNVPMTRQLWDDGYDLMKVKELRAQLTALEEAHVRLQAEKEEGWNEVARLTAIIHQTADRLANAGIDISRVEAQRDEARRELSTLSASFVRLRDALNRVDRERNARGVCTDAAMMEMENAAREITAHPASQET
ncbi:MAG TPA: hypothetical protein VF491_17605 [Vicinamibacterales bacterium]